MQITLYIDTYPGMDPGHAVATAAPPAAIAGNLLGGCRYRISLSLPDPQLPANVVRPDEVATASPLPAIEVYPAEPIQFTVAPTEDQPPAVVREVANVGETGSELEISLTVDAAWLAAHESPSGGPMLKGQHTHVVIEADHAGLDPGTYQGVVSVTAPDATNSPVAIAVTLVVTE